MFPPNANRPSQCHLLYMLNSLWDPRAPIWSFFFFSFFFFASNRFFQEPAHKEEKKKSNPQWNETNRKSWTVYTWKTKFKKFTKQKPHQTLIPFNFLLHALREPRTSGPKAAKLWGSSSGSLYVTNSCTHARTYHWPRQKYTCMHRW